MTQALGIEPDVLRNAGVKVGDVNAELKTKLSALQGLVEGTAAFWDGTAQKAFLSLMERYNVDAAKLSDALNGISETMIQSAGAYSRNEESATAAVNASGGNLNA